MAVGPLTCWRRTSWALSCASVSVAPKDKCRRRQDEQLIGGTTVASQPALHIRVEGLTRLEGAMAAEDGISGGRRELPALVGVTRLKYHRTALRAAGDIEPPHDVEELVVVLERAGFAWPEERAGLFVRHHLVSLP